MVMDRRPDEMLNDMLRRGIDVFKGAIQGVTEVLRTGDDAIKEMDDAVRGKPMAPGETPEDTFINVLALMKGAMEEARETGSATAPAVVQRARETLSRVTSMEPSWRTGPSIGKTATDMFRLVLRDLRGSESLVKLATGRGEINDLEKLIDWADDVGNRLGKAQKVVAQPKPGVQPPAGVPATGESPRRSALSLPTTEETVTELKRRLGRELYRIELDLVAGGRIAGKPCDCLGSKHHFGIEATAEELIPMDTSPIYPSIISWLKVHQNEFEVEEVAKRPPEHYQALAPEVRRFRKEVLGTESLATLRDPPKTAEKTS